MSDIGGRGLGSVDTIAAGTLSVVDSEAVHSESVVIEMSGAFSNSSETSTSIRALARAKTPVGAVCARCAYNNEIVTKSHRS